MTEEPFITLPPLEPYQALWLDAQGQQLAVDDAAQSVIAERRRQIEQFGHDSDADDRLPRIWLLRQAQVRLLDACDLVSGRATPAELRRAERKTVQAAALCLAEIARIRRQLNQEGNRAHD